MVESQIAQNIFVNPKKKKNDYTKKSIKEKEMTTALTTTNEIMSSGNAFSENQTCIVVKEKHICVGATEKVFFLCEKHPICVATSYHLKV